MLIKGNIDQCKKVVTDLPIFIFTNCKVLTILVLSIPSVLIFELKRLIQSDTIIIFGNEDKSTEMRGTTHQSGIF